MVKPPERKKQQPGFVQTAVRLPPDLHEELKDAAAQSGHSLNAEILTRLRTSPLEDIKRQNVELKAMLREVLDKM